MQRIHDSLVPAIGPFLETLVNRVLDLKPRLVGISSTFQQNLAAAALARLIKARAPEICVALGGGSYRRRISPIISRPCAMRKAAASYHPSCRVSYRWRVRGDAGGVQSTIAPFAA
jgi:hypothetical protein